MGDIKKLGINRSCIAEREKNERKGKYSDDNAKLSGPPYPTMYQDWRIKIIKMCVRGSGEGGGGGGGGEGRNRMADILESLSAGKRKQTDYRFKKKKYEKKREK